MGTSLRSAAQHPESPADSINQQGTFQEEVRKDYAAALADYKASLVLYEAANHYPSIVRNYSQLLNLDFYTSDYPAAMAIATKGLALAEAHQDTLHTARFDNALGFIYEHQGDLNQSARYFYTYRDLAGKLRDTLLIADAENSIGEEKAAAGDDQDALSAYYQAYTLYEHLRQPERLAYTSYKISEVYKDLREYPQAQEYSNRTLKYSEVGSCNLYDLAGYFINAGDIDKDLGRPGEAIQMSHKGLNIARDIRHREDIRDAWWTLSAIYAAQHRWDSAYFYYRLYSTLKDSITNENSRREIEDIHERYAADKKDRELQLQQARVTRQLLVKNILIFSTLFISLLVLLLYNRRRLQQRAAYEGRLRQQRTESFQAVVQAQDNERKRIAQDIHDTLGSMLSTAKLNLSALEDPQAPFTETQQLRYRTSLSLMDRTVTELRTIAHNLMPASLSRIGLPAALRSHVEAITASSDLHISFSAFGLEERLPETMEMSIYRILLEGIQNTLKHSRATLLTIQLIRYPREINIVIEDNGIGFDHQKVLGKGMGIGNILSRLSYLQGTLDIDSKPGAGTTLIIDIPLSPEHG
jgi:two-component system NarL family sensor kinase